MFFYRTKFSNFQSVFEKLMEMNGYHYCKNLSNKAWTQVLGRFKSSLQHVGDLQWLKSLTMVLAGNKAKYLSSVNHITKTNHHHHHLHHHSFTTQSLAVSNYFLLWNGWEELKRRKWWQTVGLQCISDSSLLSTILTRNVDHGLNQDKWHSHNKN